jgi:signal transduction histidine kinase
LACHAEYSTNAADALKGAFPLIVITVMPLLTDMIKAKDNGSGISEKQKKLLFQPFSTSKSYGTGLGLVIAKKMMFRMDGTIEIESEENVGTTVILTLPGKRP